MCARISLSYLAASDNHVTELYYLTCLYDIAWAIADQKFDKQTETPEPVPVLVRMDHRCTKAQQQWQPASCMLCSDSKQQIWSSAAGVQEEEMQSAMTDVGLLATC